MTQEEAAEMDFRTEWALHFVVCESLRGWFKAMQVRYGIIHPGLAQLRCYDLGLIRVRPL